MGKFGLVGVSGLGINSLALWLFTGGLGIYYLLGVILATQVSTAWNFLLSDAWVFSDRPGDQGRLRRFGMFWAMNNTALLVRGPMVVVLTGQLGVHYLVSNIVSLTVVMLARYVFSDRLVWRAA
jgi:putative flippase GtrA